MSEFKAEEFERPFKDRHRNIKSVQLKIIDVDDEFKKDIDSGDGFLITNPVDFNEKTGNRTMDGLFSPLYGVDTFTDKLTDDMYKCECGKTIGGIYEGDICPYCNTPVEFADGKLSTTGYISLGNYCIINPTAYMWLEHAIGGKELQSIIKFNGKYNVNGKNISTKTKLSPYNGIGLIAFREQFDEILDFYENKRKTHEYCNLIKKNKSAIFTHYVTVYSALLRPLVKDGSKISQFNVNRCYSIILQNANFVRDADSTIDKTIVIEQSLFEIQTEFNSICLNDIIKGALSSKKGIIRGSLTTCRVDYSARFVIGPAVGLNSNEVNLPYVAGCELMRPLLIKTLSTIEDMNIREANSLIDNALRVFDKKIWLLCNYLLQHSNNPPMLMIQRSPSLLQESMRLMHIKMVKYDIDDLILDVPPAILSGMNADFDGDTFACNMIYDNRLKKAWAPIHSPEYHFISRHDGLYSGHAKFIKDTAVSLSEIWELGKDCTYFAEWATDSERNREINRVSDC